MPDDDKFPQTIDDALASYRTLRNDILEQKGIRSAFNQEEARAHNLRIVEQKLSVAAADLGVVAVKELTSAVNRHLEAALADQAAEAERSLRFDKVNKAMARSNSTTATATLVIALATLVQLGLAVYVAWHPRTEPPPQVTIQAPPAPPPVVVPAPQVTVQPGRYK